MASDTKFKHPFTYIIGGPTRSGNSTFCIRFLQNIDTLLPSRIFQAELSGVTANRVP